MTAPPHIHGLKYHPNIAILNTVENNPPAGDWTGVLEAMAWGKSTNLFLYFRDVETGLWHRLSVFHRQGYTPYDTGPNFRHVPIGTMFRIITTPTDSGRMKFTHAIEI